MVTKSGQSEGGASSGAPFLEIRNLSLRLGQFAVHDVSLEVREGEYFVLLGPTGAGKTVVLECLAGLCRPQSGTLTIGGARVNELPPEERGIGYLPQDYALFPHLTVAGNIAFGMELRRLPRAEIEQRTSHLASLLGISHLLQRETTHLSGGERQRVALARALAIKPRVLLLDEPLSAVDEQTRDTLCSELRRIQRGLRTTTIHVSHNFEETLAVADRIGVIHQGRLRQVGTPEDLFRRPASEFVARFLRGENLFRAKASREGGRLRLELEGARLEAADGPEGDVHCVIRPEDIDITTPAAGAANVLQCRIADVTDRGALFRVELQGGIRLTALVGRRAFRQSGLGVGDPVAASFDAEAVHVFRDPPDAGRDGASAPP